MRAISAADAISPAIQRTRSFLFGPPFRWGTFLKLGLVALVTEGLGSNLRSPGGGGGRGSSSGGGPTIRSLSDIPQGWIVGIVAGVLLLIVVSLVVFYLITRLRFAFFHCLVHNTKEIKPGWRLYEPQATRFFWLNIVVGFIFALVAGLIALPFVLGFLRVFHDTAPGQTPDIALLLGIGLPLIPIIIVLVILAVGLDIILRDWMLPHIALEDASAGEAWSSVWARIRAEKGQFFVYALLRVILPTIAAFAMFIVLLIPGLVLAAGLAGVEFGIHSAFASSSGASAVFGVLLQIFFGVVAFGFLLLAGICLGGPVSTGLREYALLFYSGRYQVLGDILFPPPAEQMPPAMPAGAPAD